MPLNNINNTRPMGKGALRTVERQRQMANALQGQAMQPLGGKMAGRVYVADGPFKGAAKLAQMLAGTYVQGQADDREKQIESDQRQAFATDMQAYQDSIKGTPAVAGRPEVQAVDEIQGVREGGNPYDIFTSGNTNIPAVQHQDAIAGQEAIQEQAAIPGMSIQDAAMQQLNSKSDVMRKFAMDQLGKTQDPYTLTKGGRRFTGKNVEVASNIEPSEPVKPVILSKDQTATYPDGRVLTNREEEKLGPGGRPITKGDIEADKVFSKGYVEWKEGGFADTQKGIIQLRSAVTDLENDPSLTGPGTSLQPNFFRAWWNPDSVDTEEKVTEIVQRNLRLILGAQFTKEEGERLIARSYNVDLKTDKNKARVKRLVDQIAAAAATKQEAVEYWDKHGTLQGWKGKLATKFDFLPDTLYPEDKDNQKRTGAKQQLEGVVDEAESILQELGIL